MFNKIKLFSPIICILFLYSCKKDKSNDSRINTRIDATIIQDNFGRQLILHGLNTSSSAKSDSLRNPWITENNVEKEHTQYGFNFVRYLIFWDAIEPLKDVFDNAYLDRVEQRVNWYTSRGMFVMLDMHQDIYAAKFGGDGAPDWACRTNGTSPLSLPGGTPWWLKNIDPQVVNSWINFWSYTQHKDLQDHYILAWQKVAERFKNNPYVIGYDLMNEPWGGDLIKVFLTGEFEREQLTAFYNRLIPNIRNIDKEKYIFFEPTPAPVTFGSASNLSKITDIGASKIVYAPHCYPYDTHEGNGYTASSKQQLKDWEKQRLIDVKKHGNTPLLCGEFGLSPNQNGFIDYLKDFNEMSDRNLWHWAYWSNDNGGWSPFNTNGTETAIAKHLLRTYPKATAGKIKYFSFDTNTKVFKMEFISNSSITQPTEIFIPQIFYPNGYNFIVNGISNYSKNFDAVKQVLNFTTTQNNTLISIEINPK